MILTINTNYISILFLFVLFLFLTFTGCSSDKKADKVGGSCINCHRVKLDKAHTFSCSRCHGGDDTAESAEEAHESLIHHPAHPDQAQRACSPCHTELVNRVTGNSHYLLPSYTSMVIDDNQEHPSQPAQIRSFAAPAKGTELLQDALKRKCMRCHVYHSGDEFPMTQRATGCGACHLEYYDGTMVSHRFMRYPKDTACLSCHYGNRVGFDYYGRFEHDFNEEYRTPYTTREEFFRPYGVEYHSLEPDIHQKAGLVCIDCHHQPQMMGDAGEVAECQSCHDRNYPLDSTPGVSRDTTDNYVYVSQATGKSFTLPLMNNPAHLEFQNRVSCQACHAQWSFDDRQTHLLRIDHDYLDELERLTLDGDFHTYRVLFSNIDFDSQSLEISTEDYFSGESLPGIWVQGYLERRWEKLNLVYKDDGIIHVSRPMLDLYLSWIDSEETVRFDNFQPFEEKATQRPYIPHTIGHADAFFRQRLFPLFNDPERSSTEESGSK